MENPLAMGIGDCVADLMENFDKMLERISCHGFRISGNQSVQNVLERKPSRTAHRVIGEPVVRDAHVVHGADTRVVQLGL